MPAEPAGDHRCCISGGAKPGAIAMLGVALPHILATVHPLLAVSSIADATTTTSFGYRPFITPLPVWDYWYLLLIPLCFGVAIVYKTIRCQTVQEVPRQSLLIALWIVGGMVVAAGVLAVVVKIL